MKTKAALILLFVTFNLALSQNPLKAFDNLVGKTWSAEGTWGNGSKFKQDITFSYSLDSTLVVVEAMGYTDEAQTKYGNRNHGIRQFDKSSNTIKFWEFDVFGGLTEGTVICDDKNLFYRYSYGETVVTDMWEYVDESTYNFKVGIYEDDEWKQVFLKTQFHKQ
ncbi:hypothetical protein Q2T40_07180 [Winogradskyella maritima]|uniref:DUF1579 domain-containing protein n=1 Tax=Winogradskyella maritima TaxID=1517766 RepID=A0ABV8AKF7_9FLAO|nr:hypothetical protein [Winogradskyella maritima]